MERTWNQEWTAPLIEERKLNQYHWLVFHKENLHLGKYIDIGAFTLLDASQGIYLEDGVQIGSHCSLYSKTTIDNKQGAITLRKNAGVGSHCVIMPGITIGENAIVGAMSFVNKDIPPNEVWAGSPAKFLKKRECVNTAAPIPTPSNNSQWNIPLFKTNWEESDVQAVNTVIRRGTQWAAGPEIEEFEREISRFTGRKYALTFNSGTSALHAMYTAIDVKGKEVICPSFTFVATANAIVAAGGIPIFAESETDTFGLDAADVEKRITPNTKAIVVLHYAGGVSRDIEKLQELAQKHHLLLLEDNAHSLGVRKEGKMCGTFGIAAALSFCQNKLITTGEGGAVITDSQELYEKMKLFRSHGRVETGKDYFSHTGDNDYTQIGHNYRMPSMNAALGLSQLKRFIAIMDLRIKVGNTLNQGLSKIPQIKAPSPAPNSNHYYQMYSILLPDAKTRDALQNYLESHKIMSKVYYNPVHLKRSIKKRMDID